jgi:glycosyltransferase involved in cell wall biosynthesis
MSATKAGTKITFFSQSLQRTGSEIVLYQLLRHLDVSFNPSLVSFFKGELADELATIPQTTIYSSKPGGSFLSRLNHYLEREFGMPRKLKAFHDSVWYVNTIALPDVVSYAKKNKIRLLVHVHELEQMFELLSEERIRNLVEYPEWIIANSEASKLVLNKYGRKDRISVCYPCMDTTLVRRDEALYNTKRKELGFVSGDFLWLMSGTLDRNKNPFLFMEAASLLLKQQPHARFAWLGGTSDTTFEQECKERCKALNLQDRFTWLGSMGKEYTASFNCADGFMLSSRKESFSLATLEALLLGLPVVANDCGGVSELLQTDIGKIVSSDNRAQGLATEMERYMNKEWMVDIEKQRQRAMQFDVNTIAPRWNNLLAQILNRKG